MGRIRATARRATGEYSSIERTVGLDGKSRPARREKPEPRPQLLGTPSHCGPLPGGLAKMEGALTAVARAAALIAADVFGPTVVGRVAARRMSASARAWLGEPVSAFA